MTDGGALRVRRRALRQASGRCLSPATIGVHSTETPTKSNSTRFWQNVRPMAHQPGTGAVRDGCTLLQGLAICGTCGRKPTVHHGGDYTAGTIKPFPVYYCTGSS